MPLLRWLLPIVAALAVLGASVTAWAAAGPTGEPACCCPVKTACKCHDHDGDRPSEPVMKQCGGESQLVAPAAIAATPTTAFTWIRVLSVSRVALGMPLPLATAPARAPETPPF